MRNRAIGIVFLLLSAAACQVSSPGLGWDRNVSDRPEAWGAYQPEGVYVLQRDVFLLDVPERTNGPGLVPGMEWDLPPGTFRGPTGVADYQAAPSQYRGIIGIVAADTRLRVETLRAKGNLRDSRATRHYVKAKVLDGEFQGRTVDLQAVSVYRGDTDGGAVTLVGPNGDFLRRAQ